ncbi:hypothetical protein HPB50_013023 [Hyalomma asiaticum]|uniref:Uncharacterized protein n=1 Tax=Hyalomma asiaticum TaxID=266040 RepID=A0ACB7TJP2_HYAAI|nr:hypothetical protein HPB50_013023 [Hyalomma asiaticum]
MTSVTSESKERMPTEAMSSARSRTVSNYRDVMDNMLTEPTEAVPPSLTTTQSTQQGPFRSNFMNDLRTMIKALMATNGAEMMRNLLQADISTDCTFGLLHFTRAIQDLEPWAMRLIDATGKYPTGLLQGNLADLGAYDECVETMVRDEYGTTKVRGQYCDVHLLINDTALLTGNLLQAMMYYHKRALRQDMEGAKKTQYLVRKRKLEKQAERSQPTAKGLPSLERHSRSSSWSRPRNKARSRFRVHIPLSALRYRAGELMPPL